MMETTQSEPKPNAEAPPSPVKARKKRRTKAQMEAARIEAGMPHSGKKEVIQEPVTIQQEQASVTIQKLAVQVAVLTARLESAEGVTLLSSNNRS